ncbi:MAG: hypothetical protein ACFFE8_13040 [Candidatus Heimdallarchaeota archaeon]
MNTTQDRKKKIIEKFKSVKDSFTINFVCSGNIIRSPYAQMLFEHKINKIPSLSKIRAESAAVTYKNSVIYPESEKALLEKGVDEKKISSFRPRFYLDYPEIFSQADLILVMTHKHIPRIPEKYREKTFLLRDFALGKAENIPDPFFDPPFDRAYDMIDEALDGLVEFFLDEKLRT